jgi:hypothetical protein
MITYILFIAGFFILNSRYFSYPGFFFNYLTLVRIKGHGLERDYFPFLRVEFSQRSFENRKEG